MSNIGYARIMSLSKNSLLLEIVKDYNNSLKTNPLITKSITSGVLGFAGSLVASKLRVNLKITGYSNKKGI